MPELGSSGSVQGVLSNEYPLYVASVRQMIISAGWRGKRRACGVPLVDRLKAQGRLKGNRL